MRKFFILLLAFFICRVALATEIYLKNGVTMEGTIVELTSDSVKIEKDNHTTYRLKFEDIEEASLAILKTMPQIQAPTSNPKPVTDLSKNIPTVPKLSEEHPIRDALATTPLTNVVAEEQNPSETISNIETIQLTQNIPPMVQSPEERPLSTKTNNLQQDVVVRSNSAPLPPTPNSNSLNTPDRENAKKINGFYIILGIIVGFIFIFVLHAILLGIPLHTIAKKTNTSHAWIAFIPIVNNFTMCSIAGKSWWWALLLLLPIVGIAFYVVLWMKISEIRHQSKWLGFLFLVPIINVIFIWFLSFDPKVNPTPPQESSLK